MRVMVCTVAFILSSFASRHSVHNVILDSEGELEQGDRARKSANPSVEDMQVVRAECVKLIGPLDVMMAETLIRKFDFKPRGTEMLTEFASRMSKFLIRENKKEEEWRIEGLQEKLTAVAKESVTTMAGLTGDADVEYSSVSHLFNAQNYLVIFARMIKQKQIEFARFKFAQSPFLAGSLIGHFDFKPKGNETLTDVASRMSAFLIGHFNQEQLTAVAKETMTNMAGLTGDADLTENADVQYSSASHKLIEQKRLMIFRRMIDSAMYGA